MTIQTRYHSHPEYLLATVCGQWTQSAIKETLDEIRAEADQRGYNRILLDLLELSRPDTEMTRFYSGEYLAKILPHQFKVAAFANSEFINRFGETVAINRGAWLRVFPEEQAARQWLITEPDKDV